MAKHRANIDKADTQGLRSTVGRALLSAKRALWGVGIFSMFVNILMLTGPIYMLQVYDRVLLSSSVSTLVAISILMAAMYGFMGFLEFCRSRVLTRLAGRFEQSLGGRTFKIWLKQGLYGQSAPRHSPMTDLSTLKQFLSGNGPGTFFDIPWVPIYIAVIFILHWSIGILAIIGTLIILAVALYNEFATRKPQLESLKYRRQEQVFSQQAHRNADTVAAMGMGAAMGQKWAELNTKGRDEGLASSDKAGNASSITKAFRMFMQSATLGLGGYLAVLQIITPGAMIAGSIILGRALAPVQMAIGQWRGFTAARDSFDRLNKFYDAIPEDEDTLNLPAPTGVLSVENVIAAPPGVQQATLHGLNFTIKPGQGLGVIGPSASGKSTLARLLVGIWLPQKGAVRLDGASFDQWNRDALGPYIGYLPQAVEMFDGTVGQNISRFATNATDEAIVSAAKMAGVHDLILRLPSGYSTLIGEGGTVLSGGQNQRIGLARALYGDPVLIVLDEPNASLDADGDAALTQAITHARKRGATVIVMAHRPSAISAVDQLLVLRDGKQIAFGSKEAVLKEMNEQAAKNQKQPAARQSQTANPPQAVKIQGPKTGPAGGFMGQPLGKKPAGGVS